MLEDPLSLGPYHFCNVLELVSAESLSNSFILCFCFTLCFFLQGAASSAGLLRCGRRPATALTPRGFHVASAVHPT